ncbi:MAG: VOC family protein [bacterium]|nr:VOC family protein [bacterium]
MKGFNPVGWFEIYVQDIAAAQQFYEAVLDISMSELPNPIEDPVKMVAFSSGENSMTHTGSTGALVHMPGFPSGGNSTIVYFIADDCAVEESRVVDASGTIFKTKFSIGPHGFISLCNDPDGNMFGLHSMK